MFATDEDERGLCRDTLRIPACWSGGFSLEATYPFPKAQLGWEKKVPALETVCSKSPCSTAIIKLPKRDSHCTPNCANATRKEFLKENTFHWETGPLPLTSCSVSPSNGYRILCKATELSRNQYNYHHQVKMAGALPRTPTN